MNTAFTLHFSHQNYVLIYCLNTVWKMIFFLYSWIYYAEQYFAFVCSAEILEDVIRLKTYILHIMSYYWQDMVLGY